ncbi:unnamed protein product [Danaus chrysippus]|uniref:(African queen) hypothetical protein n=1 Tax=Danaus chrysippus TaxID=151541 RepID=A0A8J2QS24_9NEOP|nr:unnamed protein product [Danaus chrysippus]
MGLSCSCNEGYNKTVLKLQNSAQFRTRRRGCTCYFRRPKWLMIRRKRKKRVYFASKTFQAKQNEGPQTVIACVPNEQCNCLNIKGCCSRGTDTCFCEENLCTGDIKSTDRISKNVCRFTVDAYFS